MNIKNKNVFLKDLVSLKNEILKSSKKKGSGFHCHGNLDDKETRCYYSTDIGEIKIGFVIVPNFYGDGYFSINFFDSEEQFNDHYKNKYSENENVKQDITIFSEKIGKGDIVVNHITNTINFIHG